MPSSSSDFACNSLCLRGMGEQIRSRRLLYNLCLVNKLFGAEFSPLLYRKITAKTNHQVASLLTSPYLIHAIAFTGLGQLEPPIDDEDDDVIQELLTNLPRLEKFSWKAPLTQAVIDALHTSQHKLKSLCIEYPEGMEQDIMGLISAQEEEYRDADDEEEEARKLYLKQDVSNFSNLEELTITNIYGDLNIWRRQLVHLLKSSPNLRHLHLGLSYNVVERHCHDGLHELFTDFFNEICNDFTQSGCSPLKLRSLGCGTCFLPQSVTALHKLTEMEYLEELYIRNENISTHTDWFFIYDDDGTSFIPFDSILSRACPRLRRFSAHQLAKDVVDALASDQALPILPQLAVFIESQDIWDEEMALLLQADLDHPALPLKLRMMDLDLDRGQRGEPSAEQILDNLVATNAETLQGLAVHLTGTPGNFEDLDALQKALRQLPHLTQFMIVYKSHFGGFEEDECLRTAEKIANAVPQLRYISVYGHYWAIWHVSDGETSASLERLEEPSEREHVELFVHDTFTP